MEFNIADLFEHSADRHAHREAVVAGGERRTFAALEERANRLAHHLTDAGVRPGDHVAVYGYNSADWVESMLAVYKVRAACVNVNFRYVADELVYLLDQARPTALIFQRRFSEQVGRVGPRVPSLRHLVVTEDGTTGSAVPGAVTYADALASGSPGRDFGPRSGDDRYLLFTGGTTGLPKGVLWRQEDVVFALGGGIDLFSGERADRPEQLVGAAGTEPITMFPIAPLMHGATQWALLQNLWRGSRTVLTATFDAAAVWRLVEEEQVNALMVTGDAMAIPLIEALEEPGTAYDTSALVAISSSAALFSPSLKERFIERLGVLVTDGVGASESGASGVGISAKGQNDTSPGGITTIRAISDAVVLDDRLQPAPPGTIGLLARKGNIPLGYLNDPVKTAEVFRTGPDGIRYSIPGDYARVEEDGRITLLGRGSATINSGGEKIFTEEVESAVKEHPGVYDAIVVGVPHERWGQTVAVVIQPRGGWAPSLAEIQEHCRTRIAGYKLPRVLRTVTHTVRTPTGKPDLTWALSVAAGPDEEAP
jgi:acyl-CoA synthetase (AMP-forming)/AMP-acid ligase II